MSPEEYVGYENLIRFIEDRELQHLDGDIIEIGAYMGGGTVKLAGFAKKYHKKVFAVDTFDPGVDRTVGRGESQRERFIKRSWKVPRCSRCTRRRRGDWTTS